MNIWPAIALGDLLIRTQRAETVSSTTDYKLLGVRLGSAGPFLREVKTGSQISARTLYRVASGDFIYSRLFAWRGAFGIVGNEMDGCYVSGEFPTFSAVVGQLDLRYLAYWFRLPTTLERVLSDCTGSTPLTRNRFNERFLLNLEIPLPPIDEQRRIVAKIEKLAAKIKEAQQLRQAIQADTKAMLLSTFQKITEKANYLPMAEVAPIIRRPVKLNMDGEYPELGVRSFGNGVFHKPMLNGVNVGTKRLYYMNPGDLVFNNVFAWEGAIAVVRTKDAGRVGSHRFITCVAREGVVTPEFLCFYLLTGEGLEKLREASPGGAGRNRTLGLKKLETITVPVPFYEKQLWFNRLQSQLAEIKKIHADNKTSIDALLPSILDKAFKGEL